MRMIKDEKLMITGSRAYNNSDNADGQNIPQIYPVNFQNETISNNIQHLSAGAPFIVRESGVYILFFALICDNASQFSVFVNGVYMPLSSVGSNSGAGQVVSRHLLKLKKNDSVIIRNYVSSSAVIATNTNAGGTQLGNDATFLLVKISSYEQPKYNKCALSHKQKRLFEKLECLVMDDCELMPRGFDVRGTFFSNLTQTVALEDDFVFSAYQNVNKLTWNALNPNQVTVVESGIYKVFAMINTNNTAQITLCVNSVPNEDTTQGTNKGAGQLTMRTILSLNAGDVLSIRNHSTSAGPIIVDPNCGGTNPNVSLILTIFKVTNLTCPQICTVDKCIEEKFECKYNKFINFLMRNRNRKLQIAGSSSYFSVSSAYSQKVSLNQSFIWNENILVKNIEHIQGTGQFKVKESGVYDLFGDIVTNESLQYTLFVNGVPDLNVCFGRNSGANRCLLRQFVYFKEGDVFEIRNYSSYSGDVNTALNPGGSAVGQSIMFSGFKLCPAECNDKYPKAPPAALVLPPAVSSSAPVPPVVPKASSKQRKP